MRIVLFASSFRCNGSRGGEESPNIDHVTADGNRTLCGRSGWQTEEGEADLRYGYEPGCIRCARALARARA